MNPKDPKKGDLIVVESTRFRLLRVNVNTLLADKQKNRFLESCEEHGTLWTELQTQKQAKKLKNFDISKAPVSVFLDEIPGVVDNIRADSKYTFADHPERNRYLLGLGTRSSHPFSFLWLMYRHNTLREILGKIVPMKFVEYLVPKAGLVASVSTRGTALGSLQEPSGVAIALISEGQRNPVTGDFWMGSHSNNYVGILRKAFLLESF
jgi:hypothetical protein